MNLIMALTVIILISVIWDLHGMDIEYYTHVNSYNEAFDNNLKMAVFSIYLLVTLLLLSETSPIKAPLRNN